MMGTGPMTGMGDMMGNMMGGGGGNMMGPVA